MSIFGGILIGFLILIGYMTFGSQYDSTHYYIDKDHGVSKYYTMNNHQSRVPVKAFTKIGLKYFCTIELTDSTMIVENLILDNPFKYEILRYRTWEVIERQSPNVTWDTLYYKGMKIYDIEDYTIDKLLEYYTILYLD